MNIYSIYIQRALHYENYRECKALFYLFVIRI